MVSPYIKEKDMMLRIQVHFSLFFLHRNHGEASLVSITPFYCFLNNKNDESCSLMKEIQVHHIRYSDRTSYTLIECLILHLNTKAKAVSDCFMKLANQKKISNANGKQTTDGQG